VGSNGGHLKKVQTQAVRNPKSIRYFGQIDCKSELLKIYRSCDIFAMPSKVETFGLVYVEAISQGLPILYTSGEGIDGFFSEKIGEGVDCRDTKDIARKLSKMIGFYENYLRKIDLSGFRWDHVAQLHLSIYHRSSFDLKFCTAC
jgi:glycosyltransferase involved in cell wall biosynthesis